MIQIRRRRTRTVITLLHHLLKAIFSFAGLRNNRGRACQGIRAQDIRKILLVRPTYVGDVVLTLPALKPLSEKFKKAEITFLTGSPSQEVLINNPYVDRIFLYDAPWYFRKSLLVAFRSISNCGGNCERRSLTW